MCRQKLALSQARAAGGVTGTEASDVALPEVRFPPVRDAPRGRVVSSVPAIRPTVAFRPRETSAVVTRYVR